MPEQSCQDRFLASVTRALEKTIATDGLATICEAMLGEVLALTDSSFGFMGEVLTDATGAPFLKTHALCNVARDGETWKLDEGQLAAGLEFHNLDTLLARVLQTGEPVLANPPDRGTPRCSFLPGHPPLTSFLGLPLRKDGELVGMIGLANRPGGYDDHCLVQLQPLLAVCATMVVAVRNQRLGPVLKEHLRTANAEWEDIFGAIGDVALILDPEHTILQANMAVSHRTGIPCDQAVGRKCYEIFHGTTSPPADCPVQRNNEAGTWPCTPAEVEALGGIFQVHCAPVYDAQGTIRKIIHIATDITPLKKTEKALADSEGRLATYFSVAPIGLAVLDPNLVFVRVNAMMAEMNGISPDLHRGRHVREIAPDIATQIEEIATQVIGAGRPCRDIEVLRKRADRPDAPGIWLTSWYPLPDAQGRITELLLIAQDLTDRKAAALEVLLNRERLKGLVSFMQSPAATTQELLDRTLEAALSVTESRIGYIGHYHEALGQIELCAWSREVMDECRVAAPPTIFDLERTGLWGEVIRQGRPIIDNDYPEPGPLKKGHPAGHVRLCRFLTVPIRNSAGTIVAVIGVANKPTPYSETDSLQLTLLTDAAWKEILRRQDQEHILRLTQVLHIIREINQLILRETDPQRLIREASELLMQHGNYGCTWMTLRGASDAAPHAYAAGPDSRIQSFVEGIHQGQQPPCLDLALRQAGIVMIRNRRTFCASCPALEIFPDKPVLCAAFRHDGTVYGFMGVILDRLLHADTDEQQLLADLADDLGYALHNLNRRQALAEAETRRREMESRLRQSQKLEAIGTLAGGIAHDFNNILSSILGYADLVRSEVQGQQPQSEDIEQVINSAQRASDLVRQILTMSRQTEQQRQPVRVQYILKEALKLLRPTIPAIIDLRADIDMSCPPIQADPSEIHQIIMNLATNAWHAMREEGGTLTVDLTTVDVDSETFLSQLLKIAPARFLQLTVADTGCGMDSITRAKIFEPYFTTKKKGEGTGLGLAVVYGITTRLGGDITVESKPGQGSVFRVYIPILEDLPEPRVPEYQEKTPPLPSGRERIMVVDNEEAIAQLLQRFLSKLGYRVTAFSLCDDAVQEFMTRPEEFDLVITDLDMPKINGIDLARVFLERRPDIPIILCTGFSDKVNRESALAAGIREFLYKPVNMRHLAFLIRDIITFP